MQEKFGLLILYRSLFGVLIAAYVHITGGICLSDGFFGIGVQKPVMMYINTLGRAASNYDSPDRCCPKGIMVNFYQVAGDISSVLPVASAVHVEAVAISVGEDEVVTGFVTRAGSAGAGDVVAAEVEEVGLDEGVGLVEADAVTQAAALVVVYVVVVNVRFRGASFEEDGCVTEAEEFAVVHFQVRMGAYYSVGVGYAVVSSFLVELSHLFGSSLLVWSSEAESGEAYFGAAGQEHW